MFKIEMYTESEPRPALSPSTTFNDDSSFNLSLILASDLIILSVFIPCF